MVNGFWGRKVGMTQLFSGDRVVPVTLVDASSWCVVGHKTKERDGYEAIQVGCPRKRYQGETFSSSWLQDKKKYFLFVREIFTKQPSTELEVGTGINFSNYFSEGEKVDVTGISIGRGFAGVVKKHNYAGGAASHGSKQGRRPGSNGGLRTSGKVIKGKGMPGHLGAERKTMQNLDVVRILPEENMVAVKGSFAGKAGSLVFIRKGRVNA